MLDLVRSLFCHCFCSRFSHPQLRWKGWVCHGRFVTFLAHLRSIALKPFASPYVLVPVSSGKV